jgi:hypothetical protein
MSSYMKEFHASREEILNMPYQAFIIHAIDCPTPNYDKDDKNDDKFSIDDEEIAGTADDELLAFGFIK